MRTRDIVTRSASCDDVEPFVLAPLCCLTQAIVFLQGAGALADHARGRLGIDDATSRPCAMHVTPVSSAYQTGVQRAIARSFPLT